MDRLTTRKDALNRQESYDYDLNGNLKTFTDRKQQVSTFLYDAVNRRISVVFADGSSTSFTYDAVGRLAAVSDSISGTIQFFYDTLDRLILEVTPQGAVAYEYDALGRRTKMTVSGLPPVTYQYDAASRLTQVAWGSFVVTIAYDAAGRRTSLTYSNGTSTTYTYDAASRVTSITHRRSTSPSPPEGEGGGEGVIESLTYAYDAGGNRILLSRANGPAILLSAPVQATYDAANQLIQFNGNPITHDANGNMTSDGTSTYTWDARNRLASLASPAGPATFTYDALGRRISKTINGQTTQFLYDGNDIVAEIQGGAITAFYLRGLNIDEPFVRISATGNEYYHTDALGSTLALTNDAGAVTTTYNYEAFGKTTITGASANPFQYTGRENDGTGLYYYRARYYSPVLGRFIREDPVEFAGGEMNRYAYVLNNPINLTDPLGLSPCGCPPPDFKTNFVRNLSTTNEFFFEFPEKFSKTAIGIAVGSSATIANTVGTVPLGQALKSVVLQGSGVANLPIANTLISGAINSGLGALAVGVSLEAGIITGSAIDAALKTLGIDLSGRK